MTRSAHRSSIKRFVAALVSVAAIGGLIVTATAAQATTPLPVMRWGYPQSTSWWAGTRTVSQGYGCTDVAGELLPPAPKGICPASNPRFHTGVDIGFGGRTPCSLVTITTPVPVTVEAIGGYTASGQKYSGGVNGSQGVGFGPYYPTLRLPDGYDVILGHVAKNLVRAGQVVPAGTPIATVGSEGNSTGCHVHFEVRPGGGGLWSDIDPTPYLNLSQPYSFSLLSEAAYAPGGQALVAPDGHPVTDLSYAWMGESGSLSVTVKNTGTATWGPGVRLATTALQPAADLLYSPGWVSSQRPAELPAGATVAPGASYTFRFPFFVGVTSQPSFVAHFNLVAEGIAWMPDAGISFAVSFVKAVDRAVVLRHNGPGGYTMAPDGTVSAFGGAPALTSNSIWPGRDIARGMVLRSDDLGGYILDGYGGMHPFGNAPGVGDQSSHYWNGWDIARAIVLRSDNQSGYVLDGWGGIHPFGNAPGLGDQSSHYWNGWDIARALVLTSDNGGWLLDGWGGIHPFGNAPGVGDQSSHYWNGWDIARSLTMVNGGTGGYVLDGYGGVHAFGNAAALTGPYWGYDVAKALAVVPNGASGIVEDANGITHSLTLAETTCGGHPC